VFEQKQRQAGNDWEQGNGLMVFQRYSLPFGLFLLSLLKLWLVHTDDIYGSATEFDALWFVSAAKHWYWGSEYTWTAFVKPPVYPLFIAIVHLCSVPLRIAIELMQMAGYLVLILGLRRAGVPRLICLISYAVAILHPATQFNRYTMADTFYTAILPLALGGLLLTLVTGKLTYAVGTGVALAALSNTREESFLILPLLIVFFALALIRQRLIARSWKTATRYWWKPAAGLVGTIVLLNLTIDIVNYRTFRSFSKSEMSSRSYEAAFRALLQIKPTEELRFIPVTSEAMRLAYGVSPSFAQLRPQLEGDVGRVWEVPVFAALGIHEMGPWFMWGFRQAANAEGFHKSPTAANRFYRSVAKEIRQACDQGRIPCRTVHFSFLGPDAMPNIRYLPRSLVRNARLFVLPYQRSAGRDDDILTESQRALYDEMTLRRVRTPSVLCDQLWNVIGRYYRYVFIGLSLAGLIALAVLIWRFRYLHVSDLFNSSLILLGTTILTRLLFFSLLDATWWEGDYERYLLPVMPLSSCFLILLLYQSFLVWRRGDQTI